MPEIANRVSKPRVCREHFNGRCMEKTVGSSAYCVQHKFEHYVKRCKENRRAGLCKCGKPPIDGKSARGKQYTTCMTCLTKQRAYDGARLAEIKALPDDIRRYAGSGRYAGYRDMALSLQRNEQERRDRAIEAAQPAYPKLNDRQRLFVQRYVELGGGHGTATRAALMAGYGKISASQGGRSAAVKASVLLKRADIQKAIREYKAELYRGEQLRKEAQRRADARAMIDSLITNLKPLVSDDNPHSRTAKLLRRLQGQPVERIPGYCSCREPVTPGYSSCEPCRVKHRHYMQGVRAKERERRGLHHGR